MTGDTTDVGAPPTMSRVYCYTVEYGPWTVCIQHGRAHAILVAAPPGGGCGFPAGPAGPGVRQSGACCPSQIGPHGPDSEPAARLWSGGGAFRRTGHKFATFGLYRSCQ